MLWEWVGMNVIFNWSFMMMKSMMMMTSMSTALMSMGSCFGMNIYQQLVHMSMLSGKLKTRPNQTLYTKKLHSFFHRSHEYSSEALRLVVAIVRTLKHNQVCAPAQWKTHQTDLLKDCTVTGVVKKLGYASWEGWIRHSLNPIGCLFDTLTEACLIPEDRAKVKAVFKKLGKAGINLNASDWIT